MLVKVFQHCGCWTIYLRCNACSYKEVLLALLACPRNLSYIWLSTEPRQKTLDLASACQMLELVLGPRPHVMSFLQFLQVFNLALSL